MGRPEAFKTLNKFIEDKEKISLLLSKGVYPYEWADGPEKFNVKELPPIEAFNNTLSGKISQEEYKHAQKVWRAFECKNFGDYHDIYLKADVMQLSDVFESFRDTAMEYYELDPVYGACCNKTKQSEHWYYQRFQGSMKKLLITKNRIVCKFRPFLFLDQNDAMQITHVSENILSLLTFLLQLQE